MNLQTLQADFQQIVLNADCQGADWVSQDTHGLSARDRLAIYHNAYRIRLIDVLLDTFEHTAIYLGDAWFKQLAADYVQTHHSTHNNIGRYGEAFPTFLAGQLADDLEVAELALMDWKLRRAFDGGDSALLTQNHLQQAASGEQTLTLKPVPTATLVQQQFNTLDIWQAINSEDNQAPVVERLPQTMDLLIWRKGHSPHFRSLSTTESAAVQALLGGATLDQLGAVITQAAPQANAANELGLMLHRWVDEQLLRA